MTPKLAPRIPIPFDDWSPVPNRIRRDVALHRRSSKQGLTATEGRVETALYQLADRKTWTVTIDLDTLARRIGWELKIDTLYNALVSLRNKEKIDFPTTPGQRKHAYEIRLLYTPRRSEDDPSGNEDTDPSNADAEEPTVEPDPTFSKSDASEEARGTEGSTDPSSDGLDPRSGGAENASVEPVSETGTDEPIRGAKDLSKNVTTKTSFEGRTTFARAGAGAREVKQKSEVDLLHQVLVDEQIEEYLAALPAMRARGGPA